ncbi:MAG TPA: hypothetical protein VGF75_08145 [Candidatus Saccharimonadales bacterium]
MSDPIIILVKSNGLFLPEIDASVIESNFNLAKIEGKRHYSGLTCSWHGYAKRPWCEKCGGMLQVMPESAFWQSVIVMDSQHKGWLAICRWTTEKCFPNFETMLQVYNSVCGTKYKPQQFIPF